MKRNMKLVAYGAVPIIALGLLGAGIASANGMGGMFGFGAASTLTPDQIASRQQTMFQNEATLLGISVDDVKTGWAQGQTLLQIAEAHGLTQAQLQQKLRDARQQQVKTMLQTLVSQNVITQAQADQRLQFLQSAAANGKGRRGMMGMHLGLF